MGQACSGPTGLSSDTFHVPEASYTVQVRTTRKMGWVRDLPHFQDKFLDVEKHSAIQNGDMPSTLDLRPEASFEVYEQGSLGSATANAICAALHLEQARQGKVPMVPSRLFMYYNQRAVAGKAEQDCGATFRDGLESLKKLGVCDEDKFWPYDDDKFAVRPPSQCYKAALGNVCKDFARVEHTLEALKGCIAAGFPFVFGFTVYSDFFSTKVMTTGIMSFPPQGAAQGGHAVLACGFDDANKWFIVRNSWGERWGCKGYFFMPYSFITHPSLAGDFWAIKFADNVEFPMVAP